MKYKIIEEITYGGQKHYYIKVRKYCIFWKYLYGDKIGYSSMLDAIREIDVDKNYRYNKTQAKIRQKRVVEYV